MDFLREELQAVDIQIPVIAISAQTEEGLDNLRENFLKVAITYISPKITLALEPDILVLWKWPRRTKKAQKLAEESIDLELIAEELRLSQLVMGSITGN